MSRFINRVECADEVSIAALKKQNAELVEALEQIAETPNAGWIIARAALAKLRGIA